MNERFDPYIQLIDALHQKEQTGFQQQSPTKERIKTIAEGIETYQPASAERKLDAAFAYYVAGYYARAYNLASVTDLPSDALIAQRWLCFFLAKDFKSLETEIQAVLGDASYSDEGVRAGIESGDLARQAPLDKTTESKVLDRVLSRSLAGCFSGFLLFVRKGDKGQLGQTYTHLTKCEHLAIKARDSQWWWWLACVSFVVNEFEENSLWSCLQPMRAESDIVNRYIESNYRREKNPVVELWRSQIDSLGSVNDPERKSFVLKMPTGAGKTRVAELMILRFLLDYHDQPDLKCVYIAPFRVLASEVEETLSNSFKSIPSARVSTFYGWYEVDPLDQAAIEQSRILVVTPEKLDGLLRQNPKLMAQIRLVIIDEGHLIGDKERGPKLERLLQRLVYVLKIKRDRTERQGTRLLFVSGVLPNPRDFADWLTGDCQNTIESNWRPAREPAPPRRLEWNGKNFIRSDTKQPICLPAVPLTLQQKLGANENDPDYSFVQAVGQVAVFFASQATTMLFSARKGLIGSGKLLAVIKELVQQGIFEADDLPSQMQRDNRYQVYYDLLEHGVAMHHSGLPEPLRKEIEKRIYAEKTRLVLASPTLAQGVNLPVHIILVYGLDHSHGERISDTTFWNVVGRIGRPLPLAAANRQDTPPEIWFLLDKSGPHRTNDERFCAELLQNRDTFRVSGAFWDFLKKIRERWNSKRSGESIACLVLTLAENDLTWIDNGEQRQEVQTFLDTMDMHLNDLSRETGSSSASVEDWLQEATAELVRLFQGVDVLNEADLDYIKQAIRARVVFLSKAPEKQRDRDYLLGLPQQDRTVVLAHQDELLDWYRSTGDIFAGKLDSGLEHLAKIMDFVSRLSIANDKTSPDDAPVSNDVPTLFDMKEVSGQETARQNMFKAWVRGDDQIEIARCLQAISRSVDLDYYRENVLEKGLPWGMSAIGRFLSDLAQEKQVVLPRNLQYLPSLIKYGVPSEMACYLVRMGFSRSGAKEISDLCTQKPQPDDIFVAAMAPEDFGWTIDVIKEILRNLTESDIKLTLSDEDMQKLADIRQEVVPRQS